MKIAYMGVKGLPSKSGTERVIEAVVNQLIGRHEITVYCDSFYTPKNTKINGVKLIRIPTFFKGKYTRAPALDILSTLHALLFGNYDVIHLNGVENTFILPLLRLRYRVVSTSHGNPGRMPYGKWGPIAGFFLKQTEYPFLFLSNITTTISSADAIYFDDRFNKKIIYIPNGVDQDIQFDQVAAQSMLSTLGIESHNYILFVAGRIIQRKGCHILLDAFKQIDSDFPLLIIGDLDHVPSYAKELKQMVSNKRVIFIPAISNKTTLFGIMKQCRLFVFPSTAEGMSMILLEAASLDIPLVCSDIQENTSVLGDSALYFRSGDAEDLAVKIQYSMNNMEEMEFLAHKASDMVKNCYSWEKIALQYEKLYECCFKGRSIFEANLDGYTIENPSSTFRKTDKQI
jgi:glycosyltransferase involved in cell wall biosynthesis